MGGVAAFLGCNRAFFHSPPPSPPPLSFGHVYKDGVCRTDISGVAVESSEFSCFCVFEKDADPSALAANAAIAKEKQTKEGDAAAPTPSAPRKAAEAPAPGAAPKK